MDLINLATHLKAGQIRHDTEVGVLVKLKDQQQREGQAAVSLIETAGAVRGAPEAGKGALVDVRA